MSARRWGVTTGLGLILFAILLALTAFGIWKLGTWIGFFLVYSWVLTQITSYGLDSNLAKIASVVIGCAVWFGALRLMKKNLVWGAIIVITLIIAQSSFLYVMSRNRYFNPTSGSPTKFYTMNPVSGQYQLFDQPIFDAFGQQAEPVTAEIATKIERRKNTNNCANNVVVADKIEKFFDPESGQALVFYCKDPEGKYRLFNSPGYDPKTGQKLEPVNATVMNDIICAKTPSEKPKNQGLMIFRNTDSAGVHTVCNFSGDYQILTGKSIVDAGTIEHGVCELGWWKTGPKIKVRYRSWGRKYVTSDFCKLENGHYIIVDFPPPAAQSTQAPAVRLPTQQRTTNQAAPSQLSLKERLLAQYAEQNVVVFQASHGRAGRYKYWMSRSGERPAEFTGRFPIDENEETVWDTMSKYASQEYTRFGVTLGTSKTPPTSMYPLDLTARPQVIIVGDG